MRLNAVVNEIAEERAQRFLGRTLEGAKADLPFLGDFCACMLVLVLGLLLCVQLCVSVLYHHVHGLSRRI